MPKSSMESNAKRPGRVRKPAIDTDHHGRKIWIDVPCGPTSVVVTFYIDPIASGGTGTKPPKKVTIETKPKTEEWPPEHSGGTGGKVGKDPK